MNDTQPDTYEIHGYREELTEVATRKCVGSRAAEKPTDGRKLGVDGSRIITISESFTVQGWKEKRIVVRRPTEFISRIYPICGRMLRNIHAS